MTTHPPADGAAVLDSASGDPTPLQRRRTARAGLVAVLVVVALVAFLGGRLIAAPEAPADTSAEAGFARDMQTHHAQAVRMSMMIRERTTDPEVRTVAYDIALTQQQQIGQMYAWLQMWGLPQTGPRAPMAWMTGPEGGGAMAGHAMVEPADTSQGSGAAAMPGMASEQELARLARLEGRDAETLYLQLMIDHHRAGVAMAEAVLGQTDLPVVSRFARTIVASQTAEIGALQDMLQAREDAS